LAYQLAAIVLPEYHTDFEDDLLFSGEVVESMNTSLGK
jgi:hypothetical protein